MTTEPTADRAALRERIADALHARMASTADIRIVKGGEYAFVPEVTDAERMLLADAVMAALPAPTDRAAEDHRLALSMALNLGTSAPWDAIHDRATELGLPPLDQDPVARRLGLLAAYRAKLLTEAADALDADMERFFTEWPDEPRNSPYANGRKDAAAELRRLAAEAPTTTKPETDDRATIRAEAGEAFRALFGDILVKGQDGDWANVADYIATEARIPACGSFYPHHVDTRCVLHKGHRGSHRAPWGTRDMAWPYDPRETQPAAGVRQDGAQP